MNRRYGLKKKGTDDIIGVFPIKMAHGCPKAFKKYLDQYEEITLYTEDEVEKLQAEINNLKADAARYRWVKDNCVDYSEATDSFELRLRYGGVFDDGVDAEIDRRMSKTKNSS